MLTLTREVGQSFIVTVPPSTETTVIEVMLSSIKTMRTARFGFIAPRHVGIVRKDLLQRIAAQSQEDSK